MAVLTLWDRYLECRQAGMAGIPRAELLGHMAQAAETLDRLAQKRLQHPDVRPDNLQLQDGKVKIAEIGRDNAIEPGETVRGGVTPIYAAPETFDGTVTHHTDQYSLAIVYQELLTGCRPFSGTTVAQIVMQHLKNAPDLAALPSADRAVVGRALAKRPEERFPTCVQFVKALQGNAQ
jgi:eukaryotic-like serine/threonine-protein kinase